MTLGLKRTCTGCQTRFYDLNRSPAPCPTCGKAFEIQQTTKGRRARHVEPKLEPVLSPIDVELGEIDDVEFDRELEHIEVEDSKH